MCLSRDNLILEYVLDTVLESVLRVRVVAAGVRCVKVFAGGISHRKRKEKKSGPKINAHVTFAVSP